MTARLHVFLTREVNLDTQRNDQNSLLVICHIDNFSPGAVPVGEGN